MSNSQKLLLLEMEKEELIKEKDELVNETKYLWQKLWSTEEAVQEHVAFILSQFQQTMEVINEQQERLKNSLHK